MLEKLLKSAIMSLAIASQAATLENVEELDLEARRIHAQGNIITWIGSEENPNSDRPYSAIKIYDGSERVIRTSDQWLRTPRTDGINVVWDEEGIIYKWNDLEGAKPIYTNITERVRFLDVSHGNVAISGDENILILNSGEQHPISEEKRMLALYNDTIAYTPIGVQPTSLGLISPSETNTIFTANIENQGIYWAEISEKYVAYVVFTETPSAYFDMLFLYDRETQSNTLIDIFSGDDRLWDMALNNEYLVFARRSDDISLYSYSPATGLDHILRLDRLDNMTLREDNTLFFEDRNSLYRGSVVNLPLETPGITGMTNSEITFTGQKNKYYFVLGTDCLVNGDWERMAGIKALENGPVTINLQDIRDSKQFYKLEADNF